MTKKLTINKGFTLVELLVSVSLLAILSGVLFSVLNARGMQAKARDAQRISDLTKIKIALEQYFADNRAYPSNAASPYPWSSVSVDLVKNALVTNYINVLPLDPKATATVCDSSVWRGYVYKPYDSLSKYLLAANMEVASSAQACPVAAATCGGCTFPADGYAYYTTAD